MICVFIAYDIKVYHHAARGKQQLVVDGYGGVICGNRKWLMCSLLFNGRKPERKKVGKLNGGLKIFCYRSAGAAPLYGSWKH
jgi:hypothetical protein